MPALSDPRQLSSIPLFAGLAEAELQELNTLIKRRRFPPGSNVITLETPGETVYLVLSGTVKIKIDQADGTEVIIAMLGGGELVGELSVLDSEGRSADVVT